MGVVMRFKMPFTKKITEREGLTAWNDATVRTAEKLRQQLSPRDMQAIAYLEVAVGVAHACAMTNANVSASIPMRLVRRVDDKDPDRRAYGRGKTIGLGERKAIARRLWGTKAGSLVDSGAEIEEVKDHPILDLIADPCSTMTGKQAAVQRFYFQDIVGKFFSLIPTGSGGYPTLMLPLMPQYTRIDFGEDGIEGYVYGRAETAAQWIDAEDVIFFRHAVHRDNPLDGEGPMAGIVADAELIQSALIHDIAMAHEGYRPDSMLNIPATATDETAKEIERTINARRGIKSAARVHVTRGEATLTPLVFNPKELRTAEQLDRSERRIRTAFGHTESMGDLNSANLASAREGYSVQYMDEAIQPRVDNMAEQLTKFLVPRFGLDPTEYCFVADAAVEQSEDALVDRMVKLRQNNLASVDEARTVLGYDAIGTDEAKDPLYAGGGGSDPLAGFGIPSSFLSAGKAAPEPETAPERPRFNMAAHVKVCIRNGELPEYTACTCGPYTKDDDDIQADPLLREAFRRYRSQIEESMERALRAMQDEVVDAEANGREPDLDSLKADAARSINEDIQGVAELAGRSVAEQFDLGDDAFSVVPQSVLDRFERHSIMVAEDIAHTTETIIRPAVERGLAEGLSIDEVASEIEGVPKYRAERIARTEIQNAAQGARYELWKETGVVEMVDWVNAPGASRAHQIIASRSPKKLGEPFVKAGEEIAGEKFTRDVEYPPARPNCRCSIQIHETEGDDE
jgi:hypothetical protein